MKIEIDKSGEQKVIILVGMFVIKLKKEEMYQIENTTRAKSTLLSPPLTVINMPCMLAAHTIVVPTFIYHS